MYRREKNPGVVQGERVEKKLVLSYNNSIEKGRRNSKEDKKCIIMRYSL